MRKTVASQLVASGLLSVSLGVGCSGPLDKAPGAVRSALDPFLKAGYVCDGPASDNSAFGQWECDLKSPDGVAYYVVLDADDSAVKQVTATVDQSGAAPTREDVATRFFSQVTDINVGGSTVAIKDWVNGHVNAGGQEHVGSTLITLDSLRTVTHLVLFASG